MRTLLCIAVVSTLLSPALHAVECFADGERIIHSENSPYQYIAVIEDPEQGTRYISNQHKGLHQGGIVIDDPDKLLFEYTEMAFLALAFLEEPPRDALFVGLGAGVMPRYMRRFYPEVRIDNVEIDPAIVSVAERFFHFKGDANMKVHVQDGRIFVKKTKQAYDIVFLDAYQGGTIPFHLTTREFMKEVRRRLKPGGVVASNILSPFKNKFFTSMVETFLAEFPQLCIVRGMKSDNYIFIATQDKAEHPGDWITKRARRIVADKRLDIDLGSISWRCKLPGEYREPGARILTDDFAPANLYQHMESRQ